MATATPYLSDRRAPDGTAEVRLRVSMSRTRVWRIGTGIRVPVSRWNPDTHSLVLPRLETAERRSLLEMKSRVDGLCRRLLDRLTAASAGGVEIDRAWLSREVALWHNPDSGRGGDDLAVLFDEFVDGKEARGQSVLCHRTLGRAIRAWEEVAGRRLTTAPGGWTGEDVEAFERWLTAGGRARNTVAEMMMKLRGFARHCVKGGKLPADPFLNYKAPDQTYGTPYFLTMEERDALYHAPMPDRRTAVQRDVFVFQCMIGCRVSDLLKLRRDSVVDGAVEYIATKTAGKRPLTVRVPLTATAREIIERYAGRADGRLLPFISYRRYCLAIRRAFTAAGLTRPVTVLDPVTRREVRRPLNEIASSHLARRTFIGNLYRQVKDPNLIGALSGHVEGSKAFARYRTIDDEVKRDIVGLLEK